MRAGQRGFSLLEMLLALAIGLALLTAASRVFVSAHEAWRLQGMTTRLQDDARLALLRMAQDIRMAGMFGCLRLEPEDFETPGALAAFAQPLVAGPGRLNLVVAQLPGMPGEPDWTLLTDCVSYAQVRDGGRQGQDLAVAISRHRYQLVGTTLQFRRGTSTQPLIDHVRELQVTVVGEGGEQRVDIQLTLFEPTLGIEQHHALSVAVRNWRVDA